MVLCLALLAAAAVMDCKASKISNRLILGGLAVGFLFQVTESGIWGAGVFLINVSIPVILCYLLFLMRALGAGDIKLFSVVGGICGFQMLFQTVAASFAIAACMSLWKLLYHRSVLLRLSVFGSYVSQCLASGKILKYPRESEGKQHIIHFSIAILVGFGIAMGVSG